LVLKIENYFFGYFVHSIILLIILFAFVLKTGITIRVSEIELLTVFLCFR
jgi:hypothetical protein